jgi:hypothetical protein
VTAEDGLMACVTCPECDGACERARRLVPDGLSLREQLAHDHADVAVALWSGQPPWPVLPVSLPPTGRSIGDGTR